MKKSYLTFALFSAVCACPTLAQEKYEVSVYADSDIPGIVYGVSDNGDYAVGNDNGVLANNAFMWQRSTGKFTDIFGVDPTGAEQNPAAQLYAVSNDGTAVGCFYDGNNALSDGTVPLRPGVYKDGVWTALPGFDGVELTGGDGNGCAMTISADGTIIGGQVPVQAGKCVPVLWKNGKLERIDNIEYLGQGAYVEDMTDDGSILCGMAEWDDGSRSPAIWKDGKMVRLIGTEPAVDAPEKWEYFYDGRATAISRDGSCVGGTFDDGNSAYGFYWNIPETFDQEHAGSEVRLDQMVTYVYNDNKTLMTTPSAYGPASVYTDGGYKTLEEYYDFTSDYTFCDMFDASADEKVIGGTFIITSTMGSINAPVVITMTPASGVEDTYNTPLSVSKLGSTLIVNGQYTEVAVYDTTGRCVLKDNSGNNTVSLETLGNGVYVAKVTNGTDTETLKIRL